MAGRTGEVLCTCMCYGNRDALEPCAEVWFSFPITSVCPGSTYTGYTCSSENF